MIDQNIQVWWTSGQEWVVKWDNNQYFYRPELDYETWTMSTPPVYSGAGYGNYFNTN